MLLFHIFCSTVIKVLTISRLGFKATSVRPPAHHRLARRVKCLPTSATQASASLASSLSRPAVVIVLPLPAPLPCAALRPPPAALVWVWVRTRAPDGTRAALQLGRRRRRWPPDEWRWASVRSALRGGQRAPGRPAAGRARAPRRAQAVRTRLHTCLSLLPHPTHSPAWYRTQHLFSR